MFNKSLSVSLLFTCCLLYTGLSVSVFANQNCQLAATELKQLKLDMRQSENQYKEMQRRQSQQRNMPQSESERQLMYMEKQRYQRQQTEYQQRQDALEKILEDCRQYRNDE
ncbi:hypothetical protein [Thalassotalea mangrovi]|uniref:DUF1090 domain-containing protein n=1 Tax=Thalassotalea mangrovi TaxID=2572245 RepID=A0A4V5NXQ9_9GAMM|nr:hypothetical protein [Thalassotalea mangrovi]TKB47131.1 hypothetical protein E8M12_02405 [Thalassotalea mangrovi]